MPPSVMLSVAKHLKRYQIFFPFAKGIRRSRGDFSDIFVPLLKEGRPLAVGDLLKNPQSLRDSSFTKEQNNSTKKEREKSRPYLFYPFIPFSVAFNFA